MVIRFSFCVIILLFNTIANANSFLSYTPFASVLKIKGDSFNYLGQDRIRKKIYKDDRIYINSLINVNANSRLYLLLEKTTIVADQNSRFYIKKSLFSDIKYVIVLIKGRLIVKTSEGLGVVQLQGDNERFFVGNFFNIEFDSEFVSISKFKNSIFKFRQKKNSVSEQMNNIKKIKKGTVLKSAKSNEFSDEFNSSFEDEFEDSDESSIVIENNLNDYSKFFKEKERESNKIINGYSYSIGSFYYLGPPIANYIDQQTLHGDLNLKLSSRFNGFGGKFNTTGNFQLSNRKDVYNNIFNFQNLRDDHRSYINLNEFYYFKSGKKIDFTIGKKILNFGKGMIYSPSSKFVSSDQMNVFTNEGIGTFITQLDFYIGDSTLSFILIPYMIPSLTPTQNSRWSQQIDGSNFTLISKFPKGAFFDLSIYQTIINFKTTLGSTDFEFSFFNGPNNQPVVKKNIEVVSNEPVFTLDKLYPLVSNFSLGFSTTFGKVELHGESLLQFAEKGFDDSYLANMIGFRYSMDDWSKYFMMDSISFIVEFINENMINAQSAPFYVASSVLSRIYQKSLLGSTIFKYSDNLAFNFDYHFDFLNNGSALLFGLGYRFKSGLKLTGTFGFLDGDANSLMGTWKENDFFSINLIKVL